MQDIKISVEKLNNIIFEGKILDAFEKFYADDMVMRDNDYPAIKGKEENRIHEEVFVNGLTEFRGAKILNTIISDGIAVIEWRFDYTRKDYGVRDYKQVSVQQWKDEKIVEEKFYYNY